MSLSLKFVGTVGVLLVVSACSSSNGGGGDPMPDPDVTTAARALNFTQQQNPLRFDGDPTTSNTAVVVTQTGPDTFSFDFVEGYSQDTGFDCTTVEGGGLMCSGSGDNIVASGSYGEINGQYSGALVMFALVDDGYGQYQIDNSVYYGTDQANAAPVVLPTGSVLYTGSAAGGATVGSTYGLFSGSSAVSADFGTNMVSGAVSGTIASGEAVTATWTEAVYDPVIGAFTTADGSNFTFSGTSGVGGVDGGFFGPDGQEVAGGLWVGNETGGGSFVFVAQQ